MIHDLEVRIQHFAVDTLSSRLLTLYNAGAFGDMGEAEQIIQHSGENDLLVADMVLDVMLDHGEPHLLAHGEVCTLREDVMDLVDHLLELDGTKVLHTYVLMLSIMGSSPPVRRQM